MHEEAMIFKDHIDRVLTDVPENYNHVMVRGVIFFLHFRF